MDKSLIFDIGFHKGEDTRHYLSEGYRVIAVEANPLLVSAGQRKFSQQIASGQLTLLNVGIADHNQKLTFWVNEHRSEWSSFDQAIGCRHGTACHAVEVTCIRTDDLIQKYGVPYYLKVDIEGYDKYCLRSISPANRPRYLSCEAVSVDLLNDLSALGYTKFKIINQSDRFRSLNLRNETDAWHSFKRMIFNGVMNRTLDWIPWKFPLKSSGPFGESTHGPWMSRQEVADLHRAFLQFDKHTPLNPMSWFDYHATT
ncbi:MAG: FkbM family methyltransferase [Bernardetiaceae bacterium]